MAGGFAVLRIIFFCKLVQVGASRCKCRVGIFEPLILDFGPPEGGTPSKAHGPLCVLLFICERGALMTGLYTRILADRCADPFDFGSLRVASLRTYPDVGKDFNFFVDPPSRGRFGGQAGFRLSSACAFMRQLYTRFLGDRGHEGKNREMFFLLVPLISSCFLEFPFDSRRFFERILLTGLVRIRKRSGSHNFV